MISFNMRIGCYYSTIREELSSLIDNSLTLLDRQNYIGFFKCFGPSYIRSIRPAQEITAIFEFEESSSEKASEFSSKVQVQSKGGGNKLSRKDIKYEGYYKHTGNRVLPVYKGNNKSVGQCAQACKGYSYLSRQ